MTECPFDVQSAIGEGMTRKDHSDVSNQVTLISQSVQNLLTRAVRSSGTSAPLMTFVGCFRFDCLNPGLGSAVSPLDPLRHSFRSALLK